MSDNNLPAPEEKCNPIVRIQDGEAFATSGDVAVFFEKRHKDVLEAIDNILSLEPSLRGRDFRPTQNALETPTGGLRSVRAFDMTRNGFTLLAMGFTGAKAIKWKIAYIAAFNAMETQLSAVKPVVSQFDMMRAVIDNLESNNQRLFSVEKAVENLGAHDTHRSVRAHASIIKRKINTAQATDMGKRASALSKQRGFFIGKQPDPTYGTVNSYHLDILKEIFD